MNARWLRWARQLQAIAQNGLTYTENPFDLEYYEALRAVKLLALYDRNRHGHPPIAWYVYKLFFQGDLIGGEPATSHETDGVAFFRRDEMPDPSLNRVTPAQIARFFEHRRHPEWPTDFD